METVLIATRPVLIIIVIFSEGLIAELNQKSGRVEELALELEVR